jgi:hypothetical protein
MFTSENMQQLSQLPLYKSSRADVPPDSLVTVGYAINEYTSSATANHGSPVTSLNILFVILLGDVDHDMLDDLSVVMATNDQ